MSSHHRAYPILLRSSLFWDFRAIQLVKEWAVRNFYAQFYLQMSFDCAEHSVKTRHSLIPHKLSNKTTVKGFFGVHWKFNWFIFFGGFKKLEDKFWVKLINNQVKYLTWFHSTFKLFFVYSNLIFCITNCVIHNGYKFFLTP